METEFTPLMSLVGGVMIGLASVLLMLMLGRIAGVTGILSGVFFAETSADRSWRAAMIAGMMTAPVASVIITGSLPPIDIPVSMLTFIIGGFIVGVGVTLGNGCTSGHGVCGLARLSPRSLVATCTFMAAGFVTVYLVRHVVGG